MHDDARKEQHIEIILLIRDLPAKSLIDGICDGCATASSPVPLGRITSARVLILSSEAGGDKEEETRR